MFSTIKGKIIFFVALVMIVSTVVNIYFTKRDVGDAMLAAEEKSARNILRSLEIIIQDDYHNLLLDKRTMTLSKRQQLKDSVLMIDSVFKSISDSEKKNTPPTQMVKQAFQWLKTAPLEDVDYYIIDKESNILICSNKNITDKIFKTIEDSKHRSISQTMRFGNLRKKGDFATFNIDTQEEKDRSILAFFLPFDEWELTIAISVDVSNIEAEAQRKKEKIIASLTQFSRQLKMTKNGFVYMFDADGNILIPPPEHVDNLIYLSKSGMSLNEVLSSIKTKSVSDIFEYRYVSSSDAAKQNMIAYSNYFKPLKWYTSVIVPVNEINRPARELVIRQSLIIVSMFLTGIIAVFILVTRIAKPLNQLSQYAKELPELDFTQQLSNETLIDNLPLKYRDEVGDLASSFILMRQELNKNILDLLKITASRQRIEGELNIAKEIQSGMVPKIFPPFPNRREIDVYASIEPAKEMGGDLYDFYFIDKDKLCFTIGDVSNKGIPAALMMVITKTLIKTSASKNINAAQIMTEVNAAISVDNPRSMFVTLLVGILDLKTGEIGYSNGGHNPPILKYNNGETEYVKPISGPVVGVMKKIEYKELTLKLDPGDALFMYTDGVTEAMNPEEQFYSDKKLIDEIKLIDSDTSKGVISGIQSSIKDFVGPAPQYDDIAMLMIKYRG